MHNSRVPVTAGLWTEAGERVGDLTCEDSAHEIWFEFFLEVTPILSFLCESASLSWAPHQDWKLLWGQKKSKNEIIK